MKTLSSFILTLLIASTSFSQMSVADSLSKAKVKELEFIVGNWSGNGWMMRQGEKAEFDQTEKVEFKLDSTAILIQGMGKSNGEVIHNALAIITYNKTEDNYSFRSYLPNGMNSEFKAEIIDNKLYWYPNENVRYVIWQNANEQWFEKGDYKSEGSWTQFFEMTLAKEE